MAHGTLIKRPTAPPPHANRDEYLGESNPGDLRLCHAIASTSTEPWLTPVVGSGCATSEDQEKALCRTAARLCKVVKLKDSFYESLRADYGGNDALPGVDVDGLHLHEAVREFSADLIQDRLRILGVPVVPEDVEASDGDSPPEWLADVFVLAAQLAKLYYTVKSRRNGAPRRQDHDDKAIAGRRDLNEWSALDGTTVSPCRALVAELRPRVNTIAAQLAPRGKDGDRKVSIKALSRTITDLLIRLERNLNVNGGIALSLSEVQSLTEFAWFCLTRFTEEPSAYPGWSDLLLDLSNYDSASRIGTPLFESMDQAQKFIRAAYSDITQEHYDADSGPKIYAAVAELLSAEHKYRINETRAKVDRPPHAAAFVTSFDLELELALLSRKEAFTVALPVHVVNNFHNVAHTCWIAFHLPASSRRLDLKALLSPGVDAWSLLREEVLDKGPVVVRLAGCPLVTLPGLSDAPDLKEKLIDLLDEALRDDARGNKQDWNTARENLSLQPAVLINEHDAVLQSTLDLVSLSGAEMVGEGTERQHGLPPGLVVGKKGWSRFWMMLGVQIRDSAFRYRIAALVSSLPLKTSQGPGGRAERTPPETRVRNNAASANDAPEGFLVASQAPNAGTGRSGVAINAYTSELEDLIYWSGFEVVSDKVEEFVQDLEHYSRHLEGKKGDYSAHVPFMVGGECNVP